MDWNRLTSSGTHEWHLHALNPAAGIAKFVRMDRGAFQASVFLDHRICRPDAEEAVVRVSRSALPPPPAEVSFLFHSAFCGSTLLSQCLDVPGKRLVLREPQVLRQVWEAQARHPTAFPSGVVRDWLRLLLPILARPLGPADYLAVAEAVRVLILEDIPRLSRSNFNEAKRFVTLIDALYEAKVRLIASAADVPERLYIEGEGTFEFERTASRLREMQSEGWGAD